MHEALETLGPGLSSLPDGETGERFHWIIHIIEGLRSHPDFELVKDGGWTDYKDTPVFRVRKGHTVSGLDLGHVAAFEESYPLFVEARGAAGLHDLTFQVGIPGDFDMALFVLGPRGALTGKRPFTDATVAEIEAIHARAGDDVVFQLEIPAELIMVSRMPQAAQPGVARLMARGVAELARRSPVGARFGVHLCLGDMNHHALGRMKDTAPLVTLANALARAWPADRPLEFMHAPFAAADIPPSTSPRWYAPLDRLRLGAGTRFVAGFAHEDQPLEDQLFVLDLIERSVGERVTISHACGLGRRTPEAAERALARLAELPHAAATRFAKV
jgi:hypothetical protein